MFEIQKHRFTIFLLLVTGLSRTAGAADAACKVILDAARKVIVTPAHVYTTTTADIHKSQATNSELIYSGGANGLIYVIVQGKWTRSKMTAADMLQQEEENQRTSKPSCQYLRDESVNGEAAAVYSGRNDTEDANTVTTIIWISKSKGLPLRQDVDIDIGGSMGKRHMSTRYEYTNVHPPAGVQ